MRPALPVMWICCIAGTLSGCSYRLHIKKKAEWAPPEIAENVKFPSSTVGSLFLDGPTLKAIEIAVDEFLPPGSKVQSYDERLERCLSKRETYDISVLRTDGLFFVTLSAKPSRCGLDEMIVDAGAVYAIDNQGRILDSR